MPASRRRRRARDATAGAQSALDLFGIAAELARIRQLAAEGDHETAHYVEDSLHADVLSGIADGAWHGKQAAAAASLALSSLGIAFERIRG